MLAQPYTLRSFRPKRSDLADCGFTATLARHGHPVATIDCGRDPDDDTLDVEFVSEAEQTFFQKATRLLAVADDEMDADERFLRDLAEKTYHAQRLAHLCQTSTLFRLPTDEGNVWRLVRAPFRPGLARAIRALYPGQRVQFANELHARTPDCSQNASTNRAVGAAATQ